MTLLDVALSAYDAGLCVVPPRQDGTKAPMGYWERYQTDRPTRTQVQDWYTQPSRTGLGYVGGAVSGGLELFEFEGRAVAAGLVRRFCQDAKAKPELADLIDRIALGWAEKSPSGGLHLHYLCTETGCVKLAKRSDGRDLIETKGEGGYMIAAPSGGTIHPKGGAWEAFSGSPATVATITPEERQMLFEHARRYHEQQPRERQQRTETPRRNGHAAHQDSGGSWVDAVVDEYNARTTWDAALSGNFEHLYDKGATGYWHYNGAENDVGATTNAKGTDTLIVFSGTAGGSGWETYDGSGLAPSYDKFSATALIDHDGDRIACARALRDAGFGPPPDTYNTSDLIGDSLKHGTRQQPPPPRDTPPPPSAGKPPKPDPANTWPTLADAAYLGPIGDYVRAAAPHTEADPVAILTQLLAGVGCLVNSGPHVLAGNDRHTASIFVAIVGETSNGKKGTSWSCARAVLDRIDPDFTDKRILGGFGSGEVLIETLAGTNAASGEEPASRDTRAMVQEGELASILKVAGRDGSTLGQTIRNAWDGKVLAARTRGRGTVEARDYHVSLVGHITAEELAITLADSQTFGGTTNRFLWCGSRRGNILPEGGNVPAEVIEPAAEALDRNITAARRHGYYERSDAAKALWHDLYHQMADDAPSGLLGAAVARKESQMLRLSLLYAVSCGSERIEPVHIEAAWALWSYCRATAENIFPVTTSLADRIYAAIKGEGATGMTRTSIHAMLSGHTSAETLNLCIGELIREGLVIEEKRLPASGKGRRSTHIVATEHAETAV